MRSAIYLAIGAFAAFAAAQGSTENAFLNPPGGYQFAAGKPTELSWTPSTDGTVTLKLQKGENTTPQDGIVIAAGIPNDGSYAYTPSASLGPGTDYNIQIIDDENPDNFNFTPKFSVSGTTGTARELTPSATGSETTTASPTSSGATTTGTNDSTRTTSTPSSTSDESSSPSSTPTGDATNAPDPNSEAMSLTRPGFMLSAVLALMVFL
ncbi:hypothetical protein GX50_01909 [[Emmonsia] crescens]|uniref:Yeast cell wall synthesis Kre9/Knh1-like N-terminal domain-containing protein n=1 Tax=[Emmonsia] crescens TaxID=73230 RepID=A0A2B7ZPU8_9EURO|nr:hypothetical protein GX50_01909 [Emmonsia crescens]